jgi:hypothetical protein
VHCRWGDDRTGMMIAAYRLVEQHWTPKEAMQKMHEFGYGGIHHLTCPGLGRYEKSFPRRLQNDPCLRIYAENEFPVRAERRTYCPSANAGPPLPIMSFGRSRPLTWRTPRFR